MLKFIWRQWSALGVAGSAGTEDRWVIDPEALLLFSLPLSRYEPRLFDEILDWLMVNGQWIDVQRLRGIVRRRDEETRRVLSAVAAYLAHNAGTYKRKWQSLSGIDKGKEAQESLFIIKGDNGYPRPLNPSKIFAGYGFYRDEPKLRRMTKEVSVAPFTNIRFLLRALFGVGSRAECILYLLTHEAGHPAEVARGIGISIRGTQDALIELSYSGLILTRSHGKRKIEYWLSQQRWWEFLYKMNYPDINAPLWLDWISLFTALENVWTALNEADRAATGYMKYSKLRTAMEDISRNFINSRINMPPLPSGKTSMEAYEEEFRSFIKTILGANNAAD